MSEAVEIRDHPTVSSPVADDDDPSVAAAWLTTVRPAPQRC